MLHAVSVFTYFVASLASVLVGHDESKPAPAASGDQEDAPLSEKEAAVLRRLLARHAARRSSSRPSRRAAGP
jgi:hypothetical protein